MYNIYITYYVFKINYEYEASGINRNMARADITCVCRFFFNSIVLIAIYCRFCIVMIIKGHLRKRLARS